MRVEMDNPIRVAVMGCNGRMGKVLLEAIANAEGVVVGAALERPGSAVIGLDAGELNGWGAGVIISDSLEKVKDEFDLIIDFTRPEVTLANLAFALAHGKQMVIGTTGFDEAGGGCTRRASRSASSSPPTTRSASTWCSSCWSRRQGDGEYTDIEIIEGHHRHKVDAPSGTAPPWGKWWRSGIRKSAPSMAVRGSPVSGIATPSALPPSAPEIWWGAHRHVRRHR
jgi:4-hydroxy-tetrahydrodipicolinate reductase